MAALSSNWKKLQARIKAESSSSATTPAKDKATDKPKQVAGKKRPLGDGTQAPPVKKQRPAGVNGAKPAFAKKPTASTTTTTTAAKAAQAAKARKSNMGVTQSSQLSNEAAYDNNGKGHRLSKGITPSLAMWAEDHDISAEDVAQAYGLAGVPLAGNGRVKVGAAAIGTGSSEADRENVGLTQNLAIGKYISLDCEMVGAGDGGHDDVLARVSIVDFFGRQVYDTYVKPQPGQKITDWRTHVSGVTSRHMRFARPFEEVRTLVEGLLKGDAASKNEPRILVGHDIKHDLQVLNLSHPPRLIRDTAKFGGFKQYGHGPKPALRVLAREILGITIQQGAHSSIEDARVTMQLFRQYKPAFDVECANKFGPDTPGSSKKGQKKRR
ncbi:rna exonuclease 4 [Ophiostoma piceae UAMH 11346]|uniref:RNA exonuclease 4 n=1 Tax=Ophiostoma piceae (strain UAMH 11346) TaxID=1262450 RepID=S3DB31_OPHP1|nr:rna exonuclease 4 [Ophiostoma piceae UAMH 11346]